MQRPQRSHGKLAVAANWLFCLLAAYFVFVAPAGVLAAR
jgi:hypothetical protein